MTLVELLVAMTVTTIVMVGITGVLVAGYHAADQWGQKITEAQTENQLTGWLDQDLHRYVPCTGTGGSELALCLPGDRSNTAVRYFSTPGPCPCNLKREDVTTSGESVVTRDLINAPTFTTDCSQSNADYRGYVKVANLVYRPAGQAPAPRYLPGPLVLYFRAPGSC
jgi:type II secretory pathway component PulJ